MPDWSLASRMYAARHSVKLGQHIVVLALRAYKVAVSPVLAALTVPLGMGCRFSPTCSQYALEAVQRHGVARGALLAARRLCRCHPWGDCGHDPVPTPGNGHRGCRRREGENGTMHTQLSSLAHRP